MVRLNSLFATMFSSKHALNVIVSLNFEEPCWDQAGDEAAKPEVGEGELVNAALLTVAIEGLIDPHGVLEDFWVRHV